MPMIPTSSRAKLGRQLSYPVTATELTLALQAAPQLENIALWFRDAPVWPGAKFRQSLHDDAPYDIVSGEFFQYPKHLGYEEHWSVNIYPVKREFRHVAHELLIQSALSALANWFSASRPDTWRRGKHTCSIIFHPKESVATLRIVD